MKLLFINENIFEPHKNLVKRGESSYRQYRKKKNIYIYIYCVVLKFKYMNENVG